MRVRRRTAGDGEACHPEMQKRIHAVPPAPTGASLIRKSLVLGVLAQSDGTNAYRLNGR